MATSTPLTTPPHSANSSFSTQPTVVNRLSASNSKPASIFMRVRKEALEAPLPATTGGQRGCTYVVSDVRWLLALIGSSCSAVGMSALGLFTGFVAVQAADAASEQLRQYHEASKIGMTSAQVEALTGFAGSIQMGLGAVAFVAFRVVQIVEAFLQHAGVVVAHTLIQAGLILAAIGSGLFIGFFVILGAIYAYKLKKTYDFRKEFDAAKEKKEELSFLQGKLKLHSQEQLWRLKKEEIEEMAANANKVLSQGNRKQALIDAKEVLGIPLDELTDRDGKDISEEAYIGFALEEEKRSICLEKELAAMIGQECVDLVKDSTTNPGKLDAEALKKLCTQIEKKTEAAAYLQLFIVILSVIGCVALVLGALFNPVTGIIIATTILTGIFVLMMLGGDAHSAIKSSGPVGTQDRARLKQSLGFAVACLVVAATLAAVIGTGGIAFIVPAIVFLVASCCVYYKGNEILDTREAEYEANKKKLAQAAADRAFTAQQELEAQRKEAEKKQETRYFEAVVEGLKNYLAAFGAFGTLNPTSAATK